MDDKLLLSIAETAKALGVCRQTVYNLLEAKALTRVKIGAAARITVDSLRSYVASLECSAGGR